MFSESEAYERFMGRWSARLAAPFLRFAGVRDGNAVLDIGCGTGALAFAVAADTQAGRVTGVDRSPAFVAAAQVRGADDRVHFEVGDAQELQFDGGVFDQTLALLVLNFMPDPPKALNEMIRVTRPMGVVSAAVWDYGQGMQMLRVFWDEAVALDPTADSRDERHMPICRKGELDALWRRQGLLEVQQQSITTQLGFFSFDDYWLPFLGGQGPAGAHVASLHSDQREQLRLRLRRRLLGDGPDRPLILQARAWAVKGVVEEVHH